MVFEDPPFYEEDLEFMKHRILNEKLFIPKDKGVSKECKDLIIRLLQKDPNKRIGIIVFLYS